MKYCVRFDRFEFDLKNVPSIEEAYYLQDDDETRVVQLFDTLEEAKAYLETCKPTFFKYSWKLAYAEVYMITECDWYFDDDYYRDEETGKIERSYIDLEMFDNIIFKADEKSFNDATNRGNEVSDESDAD